MVTQKYDNGTVELSNSDGQRLEIVNGIKLKLYHERNGTDLGEIRQILAEEVPERKSSATTGT